MKRIFLMCIAAYSLLGNAQTQIKFESEYFADSIIAGNPKLTFERLIPYAPNQEIEERHRKAGLHLWYLVEAPVEKFEGKKGIKHVSDTKLIEMPDVPIIPVESPVITSKSTRSVSMNDPLYEKQWHYYDSCSCNINLLKAWEIEQGKRNVVVAVMDSWIDYTHPDLAPNMWVNEIEANGQPGVDDDGNGYVDDIHGLNLSGQQPFDNHGTHVAGTIAAVNNNGIGVCGIAGGNGVDSGVRIMSIGYRFAVNTYDDLARGYVYAADNGAIISSNSWEIQGWGNKMDSVSVLREAIVYFMENAGQYEQSPMNGGLVVFAAGNDNIETANYPFGDPELPKENLITVASVASTGMRSTFSNYGSWIDISAPGGEKVNKENGVYSTITNNGYGFMTGTSMACPHVSGVAALVVSKFASPSLTPVEVKRRLLRSSAEVDKYQAGYPYRSKLGAGILDAYAALSDDTGIAPDCPTDFKVTSVNDSCAVFTWKVPTDAKGNQVAYCSVYADDATEPLFTVKTSASKDFCVVEKHMNSESYTIEAVDVFGNKSQRSASVSMEVADGAQIYNPLNTSNIITHRPCLVYEFHLPVCEVILPCINVETVSIEDPNGIVAHKYDKGSGNLRLTFNVEQSTPLGTYPLTINYSAPGASASSKQLQLSYSVNEVITVSGPIAKDSVKMHLYTSEIEGSFELNLRDYVYDPAGLEFVIPDTCYEEYAEGFDEYLRVIVENDKLKVEYIFDVNMYLDDDYEYKFDISFKARNSYQYVNDELTFTLHYIDPTNITDERGSESETLIIYNLNGQRLPQKQSELMPGVYIVNGAKKIVP